MVELARRHWILLVSLAALVVLVVVTPATAVEVSSRSGRSSHISAAARGLGLAGIGAAIYVIAALPMGRDWGERSVARFVLRALGVATIWLAIYLTVA